MSRYSDEEIDSIDFFATKERMRELIYEKFGGFGSIMRVFEELGLSKGCVYKWTAQCCRRIPNKKNMEKLAGLLGVEVDDIIVRKEINEG